MIKLGLVLSGGIAKGAYQLGFCKAISDRKHSFEISALSASSIGILNGYALLVNKLDVAEKIWRNVNVSGFNNLCKNLLKYDAVYRFIDDFCCPELRVIVPFYATYWIPPEIKPHYERIDVYGYPEICDYLKAGISVAPIMKPVIINGAKYYDGAILENTPLIPLKNVDADVIIAIQFDNYIQKEIIDKINCPVIFLNLQDGNFKFDNFSADTVAVDKMINYGYEVGDYLLTLMEKRFYDKSRFICLVDYYNNRFNCKKTIGDRLVRKINRISKLI